MKHIYFLLLPSILLLMQSCREAPARGNTRNGHHERKEIVIAKKGKVEKQQQISYEGIELPTYKSSKDNIILNRKGYTTLYNIKNRIPNWVAWHLTSAHADGVFPRDNSYYEDEDVPSPRATNEDYRGSGWSRGHMCPAGDNKWDGVAMRESNLLTNMCPQHASLNSGVWNVIENDCR